MSVRVGILGATGYTGGELLRLLARHPGAEVTMVTSQRFAGQPVSRSYPHLTGVVDLVCQPMDADAVAAACDVVFCALPHKASMGVIPALLEKGCRVVDLSADFRLRDAATYREWYAEEHVAPGLLREAVYGLPELYREQLAGARLVANPGCYPTATILGLAPLLAERMVASDGIVIDAKSGVSGAGRSPSQAALYCEMGESFKAYKVAAHRHTPEIEQELGALAGTALMVRFTPHLLPMSRGILVTCYLRPNQQREEAKWLSYYRDFYRDSPFVRVMEEGQHPGTAQVRGSNYCDIGLAVDRRSGYLVVLSVIDNLVKGSSGEAIQNMNLMLGLPESTGLEQLPLFP